MYLLGYDIGTSSIKASLIDSENGKCVASAFWPEKEAEIISARKGWAEQNPEMWWENLKYATKKILTDSHAKPKDIKAIGIGYQMHGLVCVNQNLKALRPSIIWCDGRAVQYGNAAFDSIGKERCLNHLLNSPGNFTAAKLAWIKDNEPDIYSQIHKIMLPGDYIAMRMSGEMQTTVSGLSEGMFWDFKNNEVSKDVMEHFGFESSLIANIVPTFAIQAELSPSAANELGLEKGTPISYRAGDQPNNALSLNVMSPGEIAATAGTSGVVYGVLGNINYDTKSRVNTFAHVNHTADNTRLGALLCINGTGILNAWIKRNVAPAGCSYSDMNNIIEQIPAGSNGVSIIPFGNGAERIMQNEDVGCSLHGINFNIHTQAHLLRAAQEGIVFSFKRGIEIMEDMGMNISNIHAGHANMFLSHTFREALTCITGATIDLYDTDGSVGAAKGAGIGVGIYKDATEAFATLQHISTTTPDPTLSQAYTDAYELWKERLELSKH